MHSSSAAITITIQDHDNIHKEIQGLEALLLESVFFVRLASSLSSPFCTICRPITSENIWQESSEESSLNAGGSFFKYYVAIRSRLDYIFSFIFCRWVFSTLCLENCFYPFVCWAGPISCAPPHLCVSQALAKWHQGPWDPGWAQKRDQRAWPKTWQSMRSRRKNR